MKIYEVTVTYRPNINRLDRETKVFSVTATSKTNAIFQAGYKLGFDQKSFLSGTEIINVRFIRTDWR